MSKKPDPCSASDHAKLRDNALEEAARAVEKIERELVNPVDADICADEIRRLKSSSGASTRAGDD